MNGLIIRVTAYHGEPQLVGRLTHRAGVSRDTPVTDAEAVNSLDGQGGVVDLNYGGEGSRYDLDMLIDDFEDEYGCKVNYGDEIDTQRDGTKVCEFDVFEPTWADQVEARIVADDLMVRLKDWTNGYPTGR